MSKNKTIVKNTFFLYFRMLLVMGISVYTSRVVLQELGVSDYGSYSLVGGFISLFGFLNAAMSSATQRYLTFDIGKNDSEKLQKTFSATLTIHIGIALLVLLLAETVGLWYINCKMVFPIERMFAVNFVFQFSIFTSLLGIIQVPYNALIIAHERMSIYSYVGIVEVVLKLLIVFILVYLDSDKLITYSVLTFVVALSIRLFYQWYCRKHFNESHYLFYYDKVYYKELISYSSWSLLGGMSFLSKEQGSNVLLNFFFGTLVNAAYGIMSIVKNMITSFISSFQLASNPQIIKYYANNELKEMFHLIHQTSKFSFYLSLIIILPLYINIDFILKIWIVTIPPSTENLIRLSLLCVLVDSISGPILVGVTATGKVRWYHIIVSGLNLLNLPISYVLLKLELFKEPEIIMYGWFFISTLSILFRLIIFNRLIGFGIKDFLNKVILKIMYVSFLSATVIVVLSSSLFVNSIGSLIGSTLIYVLIISLVILIVGINKNEQILIFRTMKEKVLKNKYFK